MKDIFQFCLIISHLKNFLARHFGCRAQDPTLDIWSNFVHLAVNLLPKKKSIFPPL